MNEYKVAIIGYGSIGGDKPDNVDSPATENILSHAHAVFAHPKTELMAIVDTDNDKLQRAKTKWQPRRCVRELESLADENIDIVIVSVPTPAHFEILKKIPAMLKQPRLIIAEKPFCSNGHEAKTIAGLYEAAGLPLMINYTRRYCKGHQKIKQFIAEKKFGAVQNCRVVYTRGLRHDGCHAIDLMNWFFGECTYMKRSGNTAIYDRVSAAPDPTIPVYMQFELCPSVQFAPCDGRLYGIFEIDICLESGRVRLINNGTHYELYPVQKINEWGHGSLDYSLTKVLRFETGLKTTLYDMIDRAVNFLDNGDPLFCGADDAIAVHNIIETIYKTVWYS